MRRIRGSFHLALTAAGTLTIVWAVIGVESMYDRMLVVALGLVLIEAGIWRITQSLFPNERQFRPLRRETDFFITLVRQLNRAAVSVQRGSETAPENLARIHADMHHSVDRMLRLAGITDEELGVRYKPGKTELPVAASDTTPHASTDPAPLGAPAPDERSEHARPFPSDHRVAAGR
jgi:uncharacterized protein YjeT (DUF2065 family)